MAHDDHYHIHSHASLPPPPLFGPPLPPPSNATVPLVVPRNTAAGGTVAMSFYSLERDLQQLRRDASAKGILSANDVASIGTTTGANPKTMLSLVIGGHLWAGPSPVPKVLIVGCHHAREWISVEVPYLIAEYLIEKFDTNPLLPPNETAAPGTVNGQAQRIKHLVGNREIWFVPMLNAEGHEHTILTSRKWRPNRFSQTFAAVTPIVAPRLGGAPHTISVPAGTTCTGVDINRNYNTTTWGRETSHGGRITTSRDPRDGGSDTTFAGQTFSGMAGNSEAETTAIAGLIAAQRFSGILSYHNFAEDILAPDATFADAFTSNVGNGMKTLMAERGINYTFMSAGSLYPTTGDTLDYYIEQIPGRRPCYTLELSPPNPPATADHIFSGLPEAQIQRVFRENLAAALAFINCSAFSAAPGPVTTFVIGFPPWVVTVVPNCWNRFRGWNPAI